MHVSSSLLPLTNVEKEFLDGSRQFTQAQQRYIRCRLRKKLRLLNEQSRNVAAAMRERSNAAATLDLRNYNKISAGSGNIVSKAPFSAFPLRNFEPTCPFGHGISNPTPYQVPPCSYNSRTRRPPQPL